MLIVVLTRHDWRRKSHALSYVLPLEPQTGRTILSQSAGQLHLALPVRSTWHSSPGPQVRLEQGFAPVFKTIIMILDNTCSYMGWVRRVLGNIWCVGAGEPSSRPVRDANAGNPR